MVDHVFKDLEILDIFYENDMQKIFICRDKKDSEKVYVNSIIDKEILENISLQGLKDIFPKIKDVKEFSNKVFIVSKYNDNNLDTYLKENHLSLSKQFSITEKIMNKIASYDNLSNFMVQGLVNKYNFNVDVYDEINDLGLFIFDNELINNAPNSFTKPLAEIISYIFTGEDNEEARDEGLIPPDVSSIIGKCNEEDYIDIEECIKDFKASQIYGLVNSKPEGEIENETESVEQIIDEDSNKNTDSDYRRKTSELRNNLYTYSRRRKPRKGVIAGLAAIIVIGGFIAFGGLDLFKGDKNPEKPEKPAIADDSQGGKEDATDNSDIIGGDNDNIPDDIDEEVIGDFYNDDFVAKFADEKLGSLSNDKVHRGQDSIKISHNQEGVAGKYLVAGIDLDDKFKSYKGKKSELSYWMYTDEGQEVTVTLDYLKDGNKISSTSKKVYIPQGTWGLASTEINNNKADYVKVYVTTTKKSDIWIDTLDLDILK